MLVHVSAEKESSCFSICMSCIVSLHPLSSFSPIPPPLLSYPCLSFTLQITVNDLRKGKAFRISQQICQFRATKHNYNISPRPPPPLRLLEPHICSCNTNVCFEKQHSPKVPFVLLILALLLLQVNCCLIKTEQH